MLEGRLFGEELAGVLEKCVVIRNLLLAIDLRAHHLIAATNGLSLN